MIRIGMLAVAAILASPSAHAAEEREPSCLVARPAGGDLAAFAATFFPKASLADPDLVVRDDFAFTLWSEGLRGRHLTGTQMRHALAGLTAIAGGPDDAGGFRRPFAALALSEVARADRVEPRLPPAHRRKRDVAEKGQRPIGGIGPGDQGIQMAHDLPLQENGLNGGMIFQNQRPKQECFGREVRKW